MKLFNRKPKRRTASPDCMGCEHLDLCYGRGFVCKHPLAIDRKTCPIKDTCPCCGKKLGGESL